MWNKLSLEKAKTEYHVEYVIKSISSGGMFPTFEDFWNALESADIVELTDDLDMNVGNRSHTSSKENLLSMIKGFASYPKYRNEKTLDNLYSRIKAGESMDMPIILRWPNGRMRIMAGNTRCDVAKHLGKNPMVYMVDVR